MIPWPTGLIGQNRDLMGADWWPYGVKANRAAIDAVLRYHHEQGLTAKRFVILSEGLALQLQKDV